MLVLNEFIFEHKNFPQIIAGFFYHTENIIMNKPEGKSVRVVIHNEYYRCAGSED